MGYLPDLDKSINKFITMSKDEYANFVEDTIQLVVKQFAEKNLLDVFDNLLVQSTEDLFSTVFDKEKA